MGLVQFQGFGATYLTGEAGAEVFLSGADARHSKRRSPNNFAQQRIIGAVFVLPRGVLFWQQQNLGTATPTKLSTH